VANELVVDAEGGRRDRAIELFGATLAFLSLMSLLVTAVVAAGMILPAIAGFQNAAVTWMSRHLVSVLALTGYALLSLYCGLLSSSLRAAQRYALGINLSTAMRTLETVVTLVAVMLSSGLTTLCLSLLAARLIGAGCLAIVVRRALPWLSFRLQFGSMKGFKSILISGIAFMAFPLGNAVLNQGVLIAIGLKLDTVAVASFSVIRSLTRLVSQLLNVVIQAFQPEVTVAYAKNDWSTVRFICRHAFRLSFWLGATACLGIVAFGPWFLGVWTRRLVEIDAPALWLLSAAQFVTTLWLASSIAIAGTNRHRGTSAFFLIVSALTVLLSIPAAEQGGIRMVCAVLVATECLMAGFIINKACRITGEQRWDYLNSPFLVSIPKTS
jgi:O-antigen/teichoic acid export membrane protein